MSGTYPRKTHCETLFAGHTPSSVGFGCKVTTKFADLQILSKKFRVLCVKKNNRDLVAQQSNTKQSFDTMEISTPHRTLALQLFVEEPINSKR